MYPAPRAPHVLSRSVQVKVYPDKKVVVLMFERVSIEGKEILMKYCLQDDGSWRVMNDGEAYPKLTEVFFQDNSPF